MSAVLSTARTTVPWWTRRPRLRLPADARVLQITSLATFLLIGVYVRDFSVTVAQIAATFAAGLGTQAIAVRCLALRNVGFLSAVVTCCGLSLLLRADSWWVHPLAACTAIGAKFALRIRGKHLFNPANLGVMTGLLVLPGAWASPGQWGTDLVCIGWIVALGIVVSSRAARFDISFAFLAGYAGLLALRMAVLGQSTSVLVHQLSSGALLLFAFFMISDPMTTPDRRAARIAYGLVVAALAFTWSFLLFRPNGLVWALFLATPLVPLADRLWPAGKFAWRGANPGCDNRVT